MDKIRALRYFMKVVETSSFSDAAKFFSVPTSSVSRRIQDLERDLQVELFHRSTRVVKPSALGEIYYEQVRKIIIALDDADDFVSQRTQIPEGVLRISAMPGYATLVLLPVLEKLHELYPDIVFDLELTNRLADITKNEVDIAIRGTSELPERVVARKISNNEFVLVASPEYLKTHSVPQNYGDLVHHRTLLYRGPNGVLRWQAKTAECWLEVPINPSYISNDGLSLLRWCKNGKGLSLLPRWGLHRELISGELIEIELDDAKLSVSRTFESGIYLLYLKPRYRLLRIKTVVDFLLQELSQI